jgi:hypothetical protein
MHSLIYFVDKSVHNMANRVDKMCIYSELLTKQGTMSLHKAGKIERHKLSENT